MNEDLKDILSNLNPDIDQETLLRYLQGKLSADEQHEVEKKMIDSEFESDAMEGLQQMKDSKQISGLIDQLNRDLKERTEKKKRFRKKLEFRLDPWIIITIIIVLILATIGYIVIHKQMKLKQEQKIEQLNRKDAKTP